MITNIETKVNKSDGQTNEFRVILHLIFNIIQKFEQQFYMIYSKEDLYGHVYNLRLDNRDAPFKILCFIGIALGISIPKFK